jgi:uncharacterized SAM-binding protein YcdF (DUF218 family)
MPTVANPVESPKTKTIRRNRPLIAIIVVLFLVAAAMVAFRGAGSWLVRQDALAPAGLIVVLSGGIPYRAEGAAAIYKQGYAPEVWISRPESPAAEMQALGVSFVGEEEYNREILVQEGVPAAAIHIFPETIIDTQQEVEEIAREMRRTGKTQVIIVTSPQHIRRVKALWKRIVGNDPKLIVRAAAEDPFDASHWWRNTRDALSVVREFLGLLNVWTGLPVRPHAN